MALHSFCCKAGFFADVVTKDRYHAEIKTGQKMRVLVLNQNPRFVKSHSAQRARWLPRAHSKSLWLFKNEIEILYFISIYTLGFFLIPSTAKLLEHNPSVVWTLLLNKQDC